MKVRLPSVDIHALGMYILAKGRQKGETKWTVILASVQLAQICNDCTNFEASSPFSTCLTCGSAHRSGAGSPCHSGEQSTACPLDCRLTQRGEGQDRLIRKLG